MDKKLRSSFFIAFSGIIAVSCCIAPAEAASEADWQAMASYEYGQDMKPLLSLDAEVTETINDPQTRKALAARMAALLEDDKTTLAAKQFICLKLQNAGTPAEVPVLGEMLGDGDTAEMARMALEKICGEESLAVLRAGLRKYSGRQLIGIINSLGARNDVAAVDELKTLADGKNSEVAAAAVWALGSIDGPEATAAIVEKATQATVPFAQSLAVPYIRCAGRLMAEGKTAEAGAIYNRLGGPGQSLPCRQAALQQRLSAAGEKRLDMVFAWLADDNPLKRQIAAGELNAIEITPEVAQKMLDRLPEMPIDGKILIIEILSSRRIAAVRAAVMAAAKSNDAALKKAALHCLATVADEAGVTLLIEETLRETPFTTAAQQALIELPGENVDPAVLAAMKKASGPELARLIDVLRWRKSALAVNEFLKEAGNEEPAVYRPAIAALRTVATNNDVSALVRLLLKAKDAKQRDEIEKTILIVRKGSYEVSKKGVDAARPVLPVYDKAGKTGRITLLPLLGRLGGEKSLAIVAAAMQSDDPEIRTAGVRALCNWPDASVAGRLMSIVETSEEKQHRVWALRAYIRVVTLNKDRPAEKTLAMLNRAMALADADAERCLVIRRASAVRSIDTLRWTVTYLDNPALAQTACQTIVELAHHRFLRNPNKGEFEKALKKVVRISNDPKTVARAKQYILGV